MYEDGQRFLKAMNGDPFPPPASYEPTAAVAGLLEQGLDPNARSGDPGCTVLHYAALTGNAAVVEMLLERGADPNVTEEDGFTPLMEAAEHNHVVVMQKLFDHGAELEMVNAYGTALVCAASLGRMEAVRLLIERGADVTARNAEGRMAAEEAAFQGHGVLAEYLRGVKAQAAPSVP